MFCDKLDPMDMAEPIKWAELLSLFPRQPLKRIGRSEPSDVMSLYSTLAKNVGSPGGSRLLDWLGELSLRAHDSVQLLANLTGDRARPTGDDLPHTDQLFPFPLAEIEAGDARRVLHESNNGKFFALNRFDFQPGFGSLSAPTSGTNIEAKLPTVGASDGANGISARSQANLFWVSDFLGS